MRKAKKSEQTFFAAPRPEDADLVVKKIVESFRREEEELVLYDPDVVKSLAELAEILLGGKNGKQI